MTDSVLNILKIALLALLYLFFARVLWAVWSEVRGPRPGKAPVPASARSAAPLPAQAANASVPPPVPTPFAPPKGKAKAGRRGTVGRLIVLEPRVRKGTAIGLANEVTFGRAAGCTVSVPDDHYVSQVHARVFRSGEMVIVEDLGSTNGTYVNGTRLTDTVVLKPGDRIQFGTTVLEAD